MFESKATIGGRAFGLAFHVTVVLGCSTFLCSSRLKSLEDENRRLKHIVAEEAAQFGAVGLVTGVGSLGVGSIAGGVASGGPILLGAGMILTAC